MDIGTDVGARANKKRWEVMEKHYHPRPGGKRHMREDIVIFRYVHGTYLGRQVEKRKNDLSVNDNMFT